MQSQNLNNHEKLEIDNFNKIESRLKEGGFNLKVNGCCCKEIDDQNFGVSFLNKDNLDDHGKEKVKKCKQAVSKGNVAAMLEYGRFVINDNFSDDKGLQEGMLLFKQAAECGSCDALSFLVPIYYLTGINTSFMGNWVDNLVDVGSCREFELLVDVGSMYEAMGQEEKAYKYFKRAGLNDEYSCHRVINKKLEDVFEWVDYLSNIAGKHEALEYFIRKINNNLPLSYYRLFLRRNNNYEFKENNKTT